MNDYKTEQIANFSHFFNNGLNGTKNWGLAKIGFVATKC